MTAWVFSVINNLFYVFISVVAEGEEVVHPIPMAANLLLAVTKVKWFGNKPCWRVRMAYFQKMWSGLTWFRWRRPFGIFIQVIAVARGIFQRFPKYHLVVFIFEEKQPNLVTLSSYQFQMTLERNVPNFLCFGILWKCWGEKRIPLWSLQSQAKQYSQFYQPELDLRPNWLWRLSS